MLKILFSLSKISLSSNKIAINYLFFPFFYAIYSSVSGNFFVVVVVFVFLLYNDVVFENAKRYEKDDNHRTQILFL